MTENKSKKGRILAAVIVAAAVIAGLVYFFAGRDSASSDGDGYTEFKVTTMTIENTIESDGEITSVLEEDVLPHTSYYLEEINVEEGEALPEGGTILTYTNGYTMTAPYDCVVVGWDLPDEEEQLTSDHYVSIAGTDVLQMEISISEDQIGNISTGDSAVVTVDATGARYDAEVSYISQMGSYSGGTSSFTARVAFDNDGSLKLGMSGTAMVSLERAENVLAVPADAVSTRGGTSYVTVPENGEQTQKEVETGISNGSYTEIKSGLSEGDTVLVKSSDDSSSGSRDGMGGRGDMGGPGDMGGMPGSGGGSGGSGGGPGGSGGSRPEGSGGSGGPGGSGSSGKSKN